MIMAGSLIKIVGVGVLEAVPCDSISLYEYRKIHQIEIIKWSRWGFLCGWGIKCLEMMSMTQGGRADQNDSPAKVDGAGPFAIAVLSVHNQLL